MTIDHLADRYALKTGCMLGHNVFFREDYRECDSERLWAGAE